MIPTLGHMKVLNAKIHGIIDYAVVLFLWLSPCLFGLSDFVTTLTYGLGAVHLILTLITNFPAGAVKLLPFTWHGHIELIVSIVLVASSWVLGFSGVDKIFYLSFGLAVFVTWLVTDYK